jgi:hypothetical protein
MYSTQLQLNLWQDLKAAEQAPEQCDLTQLCSGLEDAISTVPLAQQLQMAATAFAQIAEIFVLRAEVLLTDWEQAHSNEGPALEDDDLTELMRQSMSLELDELIAEPEPYTRQQQATGSDSRDSVAGEVDKAVFLEAFSSEIELMETQAQAVSGAIAVTEAEDVAGWAAVITQWMEQNGNIEAISLIQLQQKLGMPLIEVWLGLLLSQEHPFQLEQCVELYSLDGIWVTRQSCHQCSRTDPVCCESSTVIKG